MLQLLKKCIPAAFAVTLLVGVSSAQTTVPFRERSAGTITDVVPGTLSFAGVGQATHIGRYTIVGSAFFDDQGHILDAHFVETTRDGATIAGRFSGTYAPLPSGQLRFDVTVTWSDGTGRLAGVTGQGNVVALIDGVAPGAGFQAQGLGNFLLP